MKPRHVILGAGISGLTLAWLLKNKHPDAEVVVLESSGRAGGWVDSREIDGFLFEFGPRSLRARGKGLYTLSLIEQLGLQDAVVKADPAAKIRYLYEDKQLRPLPHSVGSFLFSPYLPLFFKALLASNRAPRAWNSISTHPSTVASGGMEGPT